MLIRCLPKTNPLVPPPHTSLGGEVGSDGTSDSMSRVYGACGKEAFNPLTEGDCEMSSVIVDLSKLSMNGAKYLGSVEIDRLTKDAYGADGSVLNILSEVCEKVADLVGCHPSDLEDYLKPGRLYSVSFNDKVLLVNTNVDRE